MSYAPKTLLDLDAYLRGHGVPTVGIVGDAAHTYGYHLGKDRLRAGDYSASLARDKAGLTNAASAIDIGNHTGLKALTNFLALAGAAGQAKDVREVIGPGFDGRAYRWSADNDWNREGPRAPGDSHEWHCHVSFYRDSEYRDKTGLFRPYIEGDDDVQLTDKVNLSGDYKARFPNDPGIQDGSIYVNTALGGSYIYARENNDMLRKVLADQAALVAALQAHAESGGGLSLDEIKAAAQQGAQAALSEVEISWSGPDQTAG